jgi:hypothetical protein
MQILVLGPSRHEHNSSNLWNWPTNSLMTFILEVSSVVCPNTHSAVEDTAARSAVTWRRAAVHILSSKGDLPGNGPRMARQARFHPLSFTQRD